GLGQKLHVVAGVADTDRTGVQAADVGATEGMLRSKVIGDAATADIADASIAIDIQIGIQVVIARRDIVESVGVLSTGAARLADALEQLLVTRCGGTVVVPRVIGGVSERDGSRHSVGIVERAAGAVERAA